MKYKMTSTEKWKLYIITVCCVVGSVYYIPNNGGQGLALPYNALLLLVFALILFLYSGNFRYRASDNPALPGYFWGCVLLALPLSWSNIITWQSRAYMHIIVIWLTFGSYILLCRIKCSETLRRQILKLIVLLSIAQSMFGLIQVFLPVQAHSWFEYDWMLSNGRPTGIFQQINLLGSFLATGTGCATWLFLTTCSRKGMITYLLAIVTCLFVLLLGQSRTGLIGAAAVMLLIVAVIRPSIMKCAIFCSAIVLITCFAIWNIHHLNSVPLSGAGSYYLQGIMRNYSASTNERWLIYRDTLALIMKKPLSGWGYGSFEHQFAQFTGRVSDVITYPHNEFIYTWMEGGIAGASGLFIIFITWVRQLLSLRGGPLTQGLLSLPLLVHTQLEYPFYQSAIHLSLFVLLIRFAWDDRYRKPSGEIIPRRWRFLILTVGFFLLLTGGSSLLAERQLTFYERTAFKEMPAELPLYMATQGDRAEFDHLVGILMRFNSSHDKALLVKFQEAANRYLSVHTSAYLEHASQQIAMAQKRKNAG